MKLRLNKAGLIGTTILCVVVCLAACQAGNNDLTEREKALGWQSIFDGRTLTGWTIEGEKEGWIVEDGAIACTTKGGGMLYSNQQYGNFILQIDFKFEKDANSGVFFRIGDQGDPVGTGIEMQVLDSYNSENPSKHDCGAIYDCLEPLVNAVKPAGEWNSSTLICKDNYVWAFLNGKLVVDMDLNRWNTPHKNPDGTENKYDTAYKDMPRLGYLGLQDHGCKVWYRNIKIKPLDQPIMTNKFTDE